MILPQLTYSFLYASTAALAYAAGGLIIHMAVQEKKEAEKYALLAIPFLALAALILTIQKNPLAITIIIASLAATTLAFLYYKKKNAYYVYPAILGLGLAVQSQNAALLALLIILLDGIASFNPKKTTKEKSKHYKKAAYLFMATATITLVLSFLY